jgi:hypothetical protein
VITLAVPVFLKVLPLVHTDSTLAQYLGRCYFNGILLKASPGGNFDKLNGTISANFALYE